MTGSEMFTPTSDELLKVVEMNGKSPENELMFELAQKMVLIKGIVFLRVQDLTFVIIIVGTQLQCKLVT